LVAAALRRAGIKTLAKLTGDHPRLIYPDGHEEIIRRRGASRIQEQIKVIKQAAEMNVEAIVVECMALDPHLQFICETRMMKSTIGVITNVRRDHMEVMGKDLDSIAASFSQSIPKNGILVTSDPDYFDYFEAQSNKRKTRAYLVENNPSGEERNSLLEENLLLAREVCSLLGVSADDAFSDDVPEMVPSRVVVKDGKRTIHFIDAFSANDVDSTRIIQQMGLDGTHCPRPFVALLNNRSDRPLRMLSFVSFLSNNPVYDYIMLIGAHKAMAKRCVHGEVKKDNVIGLRSWQPEKLIDEISQRISETEFTLVGMGNSKGLGGELSRFLQAKGEKRFSQCPLP
jgi:poly-gamma-glutamate synthase PgsB/CapB